MKVMWGVQTDNRQFWFWRGHNKFVFSLGLYFIWVECTRNVHRLEEIDRLRQLQKKLDRRKHESGPTEEKN